MSGRAETGLSVPFVLLTPLPHFVAGIGFTWVNHRLPLELSSVRKESRPQHASHIPSEVPSPCMLLISLLLPFLQLTVIPGCSAPPRKALLPLSLLCQLPVIFLWYRAALPRSLCGLSPLIGALRPVPAQALPTAAPSLWALPGLSLPTASIPHPQFWPGSSHLEHSAFGVTCSLWVSRSSLLDLSPWQSPSAL